MEITEINKLLDISRKTAIVTGAVGIGFGIAYPGMMGEQVFSGRFLDLLSS